jgi:hypothetical protein
MPANQRNQRPALDAAIPSSLAATSAEQRSHSQNPKPGFVFQPTGCPAPWFCGATLGNESQKFSTLKTVASPETDLRSWNL